MADGSIEFDTGINTDGFKRDSKTLKEAADACAKSVEDTGKRVYDAFNKSSKVTALESQISQTESKIQSLTAEMERIGETKVPTEEYKKLTDSIDKAEKKLIALENRQIKMEDIGADSSSKSWKNLQYDIDATARHLNDCKVELQELIDQERDFISGEQTSAYQTKAAKLGELNEKLYTQKQRLIEIIEQEKRAAKELEEEVEIPVEFDLDSFEGQKRQLKSELKDLESQGITFGDSDYDECYVKLQRVIDAENAYKRSLLEVDNAQEEAADSAEKHRKELDKVGKTAVKTGKKMTMLGMLGNAFFIGYAMRIVSAIGTAIKEGYQNLAQYSDNVNISLSGLQSLLWYLKNSFAAAFAPVLNYVVPALNTLIDTIANIVAWIGQLFAALTGKATFVRAKKTQEDYAASLKKTGSAAAKAGKDAERSTASFDKLNVISEQGTRGGESGGASVTDPAEMFETVTVDSKVKTAVDHAKGYLAEFGSWLSGIFNPMLQQTVETGQNILPGLFESFDMVCSDIWNLALLPLLDSMTTMGIPMFVEFVTQCVATLEPLFGLTKGLFDRIWKDAVAPALELLGRIWVDCVTILYDAWHEYGEPIFESIREAIDETAKILNDAWDKYVKPIFDTFMELTDRLWEKHLRPLAERFVEVCYKAVQVLVEFWRGAVNPFVQWFADSFGPIIRDVLEVVGVAFGTLGAIIAGIIESALLVLEGFLDFLHIGFTQGWDEAWQNVGNIFRSVFNGIVQVAENAINYIVDSLNNLSFDVPEWVPKIGGEKFGFNLDRVHLPRLASGTVVPPRAGEFAAILGDNNRETEVVSPISTMKQAFKEALSEMQGGNRDIHLTLNLDGRVIYDDVVKRNRQAKKQTGKNPLLA